jgi:hypothetical protein
MEDEFISISVDFVAFTDLDRDPALFKPFRLTS